MGKNVIQVVLKKDISMDRFINKELFEVSNGVRISQIRKSGVSEVTLLIKGLHPNSSDSKVFDYLKCLGTVSQKKVTLDTYMSGPLIGLLNDNRKYQKTLRSDIDIGPLHIIDGQKVNLSFPGQRRFCYRCFKVANKCIGRGIASDCEAAGSEKVLLSEFTQHYWSTIGFCPTTENVPDEVNGEDDESIVVDIGEQSPPPPVKQQVSSWGGVTVKWFPKGEDYGDIRSFLISHGLPENHQEITFKPNGHVLIQNVSANICKILSDSINGVLYKNKKKVYCNPYVPVTPEKSGPTSSQQ